MKSLFCSIIVSGLFALAAISPAFAEDNPIPSDEEIARQIALLGANDYHVREKAQADLRAYGLEILAELHAASESDDPEISERSKQLLSEIELDWAGAGEFEGKVRECMQFYTNSNELQKILIVRHLTNSAAFPKGEGVGALCRIIRFEHSEIVRWEAAKCIIARTPRSPHFWDSWYGDAKKNLDEIKRRNNHFHVFVTDFIELRSEIEKFKAGKNAPGENPPAGLRERLSDFAKRLEGYRTNIKSSPYTGETDTDIILYYALADLQDALGMEAELKNTLDSLDRVSEKDFDSEPRENDRAVVGNMYSFRKPFTGLGAHFFAALFLADQHRLKWAERSYKMIVSKDGFYKWDSVFSLANIAEELNDPETSANYFQKIIDAAKDKGAGPLFQHRDLLSIDFIRSRCLLAKAKAAGAKNEWTEARKLINEAVEIDPEIDVLIFRYSLPDSVPEYRRQTENLINSAIRRLDVESESGMEVESGMSLNNFAWLLANTGREPERAVELSKRSLELNPELPMFLDTLAHAYFADKQYNEAFETQERAANYAPESLIYKSKLEIFRKALEKNEEGEN